MNDSDLDLLLKDCGTPVQTPAGFQRDVWFRIEAAEQTAWSLRVTRTIERFFGFFAWPPVAVATCLAMVMAGGWFGLESGKTGAPDETSYVQSISPFAHNRH